jgi:serine/threonine-protein kinase BUR1
MFKRRPILTGQSDLHQAQIIFQLLGTPTDETMPGWSNLPGAGPVTQMQPMRGNIDKTFGPM